MKKLILGVLLIFACALPTLSEDNTRWLKVADNNYINPEGIIGAENMYGYSFMLKSFNKGQYERVNNNDIWYTLGQYTINCGKYTYKIGTIDSYGYENNFVNGDYNRFAQFQPIAEGTAVSAVAKRLCKP
jgi:hypothetical protein